MLLIVTSEKERSQKKCCTTQIRNAEIEPVLYNDTLIQYIELVKA